MASRHRTLVWRGCHYNLLSYFLNAQTYRCPIWRTSCSFSQDNSRQRNIQQISTGLVKPSRHYGTRTRQFTDIKAHRGLFHVELPELESNWSSESYDRTSFKPKFGRDHIVQYSYNKEMLSASSYLQREREKLMSQPRTEKELYHAKHTPRLFYLDREQYSLTASCLPRSDAVYDENDPSLEEFLNRVGREKNTFFPVHFLMDGIEAMGKRSDEWLIDLNNDARFLRFCVLLRAMSSKMSNEELAEVLIFLARAQVRTRSSVLPVLYEECCTRAKDLDLRLSLVMLDSWRMIGFPVPVFSDLAFSHCSERIPNMSTPELIQLIYLTGENRGAPDGVEISLVKALPDHLASLSLTELGTVCTGLFKSFTSPPTTELMMQISDHVCSSDIQTVHSFFIVGILKHFRRQYHGYQHFFQYVANAVTPLLKFYPLMSCMQILLSYATMHICHPHLCDAIADEIAQKADEWRSKDATKIMWSYGTLQYLPHRPDFLPTVVDQFVSLQGDSEEYPVNLVTSLLSLAYLQLFPWELINRLFSWEFLKVTSEYMEKTGIDLRRDMLLLDRALEVECPDYDGNRLPESFMLQSEINSTVAPSVGQQMSSRPEMRFISGLVRAALGRKELYKIHPILPQINTLDIEVHLDANNQPIPFNEPLPSLDANKEEPCMPTKTKSNLALKGKNAVALSSNLITNLTRGGDTVETGNAGIAGNEASGNSRRTGRTFGSKTRAASKESQHDPLWNMKRILQKPVHPPTNSREKWLAIVVWARNHSQYGGSKLLGQHAMKRRQLELLGYHVIDVPFQEWTRLMKSRDHQENVKYMRRKIFNNGNG